MNGSTENRASNVPDKGTKAKVLTLGIARRMLPLVKQIAEDIHVLTQQLSELEGEKNRLEEQRRLLDWPRRQRLYELRAEVASRKQQLQDAQAELESLGLCLLRTDEIMVGMPTLVNGRAAWFSWKVGEPALQHWHFAGEGLRRPIPATWKENGEMRLAGKGGKA